MSSKVWMAVLVGTVLILSACGRAPVSTLPSPSTDVPTSPTIVSPGETPPQAGVASPSTSTRVTPSSAPSPSSRTSPSSAPSLPPLVITPPAFNVGEVRIVYSDVVLSATGGKAPYTWSMSSGALPGGLTLSPGGTVSGTPATAGGFSFGVQVSDSAGATTSAASSINIAQYLAGNGTCIDGCSLEAGCLTVCGSYAKPIGGVAPFKYSYSALPPGTTFGFPSLGGTFTTPGTYSFAVTVYDALGASSGVSAVFSVFPHIAIKAGSLPIGYVKVAYSTSIPYGGGSGIPTVAVVKGALPPGLGVSVNPKLGAVVISGTPTTIGAYTFYLRLTDTSPCGPGYNCSVTTNPPLSITVQLG